MKYVVIGGFSGFLLSQLVIGAMGLFSLAVRQAYVDGYKAGADMNGADEEEAEEEAEMNATSYVADLEEGA